MDIQCIRRCLDGTLRRKVCLQKSNPSAQLLVSAAPKYLTQIFFLGLARHIACEQLQRHTVVRQHAFRRHASRTPRLICLGISPVHIRRAAVDPHCQPQTKAFPRHDAQTLCHGLHLSVRPRTQQQNLPRCIPQNDTARLALHKSGDRRLQLVDAFLSGGGVGVAGKVPHTHHHYPARHCNVHTQCQPAFRQHLRLQQAAAQHPVLQKTAAHTLVQPLFILFIALADKDLRHLFHDLAVSDDLLVRACDADDAHGTAPVCDGQVQPRPHGRRGILRTDVQLRQALLYNAFCPCVEVAHPCAVRAGNDISPFVHHVDVLPHDAADLVHDTLGALY